jgi:DNA topoisomerase-1
MVASQMAEAVLDLTAFVIDAHDKTAGFRATGSILRFDGFYRLYREGKDDEEDEESNALPASVSKGSGVDLHQMLPSQHFTEPLPRYSEASLVGKLEELGIGRPSTYASIISVLQERDYVRLEKKRFIPEDRGRLVTSFLESFFRRYVEYNFTADLESQLDQISAGELDWKKMLRLFWNDFYETTQAVSQQDMSSVLEALNQNLEHHIFPIQPGQEEGANRRQCPTCKEGQLSLKLSRFGAFIGCSRYPECRYTRPFITTAEDGAEGEGMGEFPRLIGEDPATQLPITLRKGPYGLYLQLGEAQGDAKPKRFPLPKSQAPDQVSMEIALSLMALPREVGHHPETGEVIVANIGRFGPYLLYQKRFYTLPKEDDLLTVGMNRAVTVIADKDSGKNQGANSFANTLLRTVGNHPQSGEPIAIYKGRYGPFMKAAGLNISLPKGMDVESCTMEKKVASGGGTKKAAPAKKAAAKKPAAKKPAAKKPAAATAKKKKAEDEA